MATEWQGPTTRSGAPKIPVAKAKNTGGVIPVLGAYADAWSGAMEGTLGGFMGFLGFGGPPTEPLAPTGNAKYGEIYRAEREAHAQGAAKSGLVQQGQRGPGAGGQMGMFLSTFGPGGVGPHAQGSAGMLSSFSPTSFLARFNQGNSGVSYDSRRIDTASWRHTGGDAGPGFFLNQYQGSNRGSGNYVAQVPRYSIQETRTAVNKYDKANFVRLGKHVDKKYLEPGTEQMFKKKTHLAGGARKVTRQFL